MKQSDINEALSGAARDTGIPKKELSRLCVVAGLELLRRGELRISRKGGPVVARSADNQNDGRVSI